jgi:hypothetical protein
VKAIRSTYVKIALSDLLALQKRRKIMNDTDVISKKDVLNMAYLSVFVDDDGHEVDEPRYVIDATDVERLPPVPHEMTAGEYFKEKARMKATLLEECQKRLQCREPSCRICQWSYRDRVPDGNLERENPQQAVAIVEEWAQKHPEGE